MWGMLLAITAMVLVLITTITLYLQQDQLKHELNKKLNSIVDQINDSQLYEYNFDKQQDENIKNVDQNITSVYDAIIDAQSKLKHIDNNSVKKEDIGKNMTFDSLTTGTIQLGDKFSMSGTGDRIGNDDWLRLLDSGGSDYYGGFSSKNLMATEKTILNGETTINGTTSIDGSTKLKGGKSEMNPKSLGTFFPHTDSKNYIRGDTEVLGHINNIGSIRSDKIKIGGYSKTGADQFFMEKVVNDNTNSFIKMTINDQPGDSLQIWGDSCRNGDCSGEGEIRHKFDAYGNAWHASKLCIGDVCVTKDDLAYLVKLNK